MVFFLIEYHAALETVVKPLDGDNFDVPLHRESVFLTLSVACNEMGDALREIFPEFCAVFHGVVVRFGPNRH